MRKIWIIYINKQYFGKQHIYVVHLSIHNGKNILSYKKLRTVFLNYLFIKYNMIHIKIYLVHKGLQNACSYYKGPYFILFFLEQIFLHNHILYALCY